MSLLVALAFSASAETACICGVAPRVDARHLSERMDDFLFENGFAAFRAYGPALALPAPKGQGFSSNGIDVFNKGVGDICGAKTILECLKTRVSYHADNGRCFDSYTVGPGAGCGGIRRRAASGNWLPHGNWKSQRVIEKTSERAVFELEYETYTMRGTVTADSPFVRFDVTPKGEAETGIAWGPGLDVAASRGHEGTQLVDLGRGALANAEKASGTYTAVVVDPSAGQPQLSSDDSGSLCLFVAEKPFTYYIAAAWRGAGVFPTDESWFARVRAFADSLKDPCGTRHEISTMTTQERALCEDMPRIFGHCASQTRLMLKEIASSENPYPERLDVDGRRVNVGVYGWTSGFFPGTLWKLYDATRDDDFKSAAIDYTDRLFPLRSYSDNHDIGFMLMCSMGNGKDLAPERRAQYEDVLRDGARQLAKRYSPQLGMIRSWNHYDFPVIIDNMMNLELMEWASKNPCRDETEKSMRERRALDEIARSHADKTDRNHFRPDSSAYHLVNYDPKNPGRVLNIHAKQGASVCTAWSRGQAWALYGFTMMFRETGDRRYLRRAVGCADFTVCHPAMPEDGIPFWDYGAPGEERDASAGAITASALLELSGFVDGEKSRTYRAFAVKELIALSSPAYLAEVGSNGNFLLMHSVGSKPTGLGVDVPYNFADYYYLEALLRFKRLVKP